MLRSRSKEFFLAAAVLSFALVLRLLFLNKTLDQDEMATAAWAMAKSPAEVLELLRYPIEGNAMGYPLFIWLWGHVALSEAWLRLPSVIAGACTVLLFYRRNERRFGLVPALLASLLVAVAYFPLLESQNARCYAFYALFTYLALDAWEQEKQAAFALLSWLAISTHHFAFLYLAPLWLVSLWRVATRERSPKSLWPIAACLLLYLPEVPLLVYQLRNGPGWIPSLTFSGFLRSFADLAWLHSVVATLAFAVVTMMGLARLRALRFELFWSLFPLLAGAMVSWLYRNVFLDQYFFPSCIGFFALAAAGISLARPAAALGLAALIAATVNLPAFFATPRADDWRGAAEYMLSHECSHVLLTEPYWMNRWPFYIGEKLEQRSWFNGFPKEPFWLAGAGHPPMPATIRAIADRVGVLRWQGANALVYCVRP